MPPGPAARAAVVTVLPQERAARVSRITGYVEFGATRPRAHPLSLSILGLTVIRLKAKVSESSYGFSASLVRLIMNLTCTYYFMVYCCITLQYFQLCPSSLPPTG